MLHEEERVGGKGDSSPCRLRFAVRPPAAQPETGEATAGDGEGEAHRVLSLVAEVRVFAYFIRAQRSEPTLGRVNRTRLTSTACVYSTAANGEKTLLECGSQREFSKIYALPGFWD